MGLIDLRPKDLYLSELKGLQILIAQQNAILDCLDGVRQSISTGLENGNKEHDGLQYLQLQPDERLANMLVTPVRLDLAYIQIHSFMSQISDYIGPARIPVEVLEVASVRWDIST